MEKDDKTQIQFGHYEQYFNLQCWLMKVDAQSSMSNSGKIKMIRSLQMSLYGMENSNLSKTNVLNNNEEDESGD